MPRALGWWQRSPPVIPTKQPVLANLGWTRAPPATDGGPDKTRSRPHKVRWGSHRATSFANGGKISIEPYRHPRGRERVTKWTQFWHKMHPFIGTNTKLLISYCINDTCGPATARFSGIGWREVRDWATELDTFQRQSKHFHEFQTYIALLHSRGGERVTKWTPDIQGGRKKNIYTIRPNVPDFIQLLINIPWFLYLATLSDDLNERFEMRILFCKIYHFSLYERRRGGRLTSPTSLRK